jgi:hypothetical protein
MILWDDEEARMVDDENGDYLKLCERNREDHEYYATLYTSEGAPYLSTEVKSNNVKEFDTPVGGATVVRWILKRAWIPSGRPEPPSNFDVPNHLVRRLELFLKAHLERQTWLKFMPRFDFIDARESEGHQ